MTVEQQPVHSPDGVSAVAGTRLHLNAKQKIAILTACGVVAIVVVFLSHFVGGRKPVEQNTDTSASISASGMPFTAPAEPKPAEKPLPIPAVAPSASALMPRAAPTGKDEALNSGIFSFQGGSNGEAGPGRRLANAANDPGNGVDDALSASLKHSDLGAPAKATLMKHPSLTVPAGTIIPCTLQTAINSQLPGFVTCVTPTEVRGATGSVTVLDRGTQIIGEIRQGLTRGEDRLFILWVRARSPENVLITLDSPASDELGRAGVSGDVNNHWWRRFGNALLFSVIGSAPQLGATALQTRNGNVGNSYVQFFSPEQQMATTVLQSEINIPPTLERNQGTTVSVIVARDLDFSSVYDLKKIGP